MNRVGRAAIAVALGMLAAALVFSDAVEPLVAGQRPGGTEGCSSCHGAFLSEWSVSPHGRTFRAYSGEDLKGLGAPSRARVEDGGTVWLVDVRPDTGTVARKGGFLSSGTEWTIAYLLGTRREVFLFARAERGRLVALPVVFDVSRRTWKRLGESDVDHAFADLAKKDSARVVLDTSCRSCHIGPSARHYDLRTDTYAEPPESPGIVCEACHGSVEGHALATASARKGAEPVEMGLTSLRRLAPAARNGVCASCHVACRPITAQYVPGEPFLDHFEPADPGTREPAFAREGGAKDRFITSWLMNPCAISGSLDCTHCHTPGGKLRVTPQRINDICLPCHAGRVRDIAGHSRHKTGSTGSACAACHMGLAKAVAGVPADHSFSPPMPSLSSLSGSPDACTACHRDHDAEWTGGWARSWYGGYEERAVRISMLESEARKRNFSRIEEMLGVVRQAGAQDEVHASGLIRLMSVWPEPAKERVLLDVLRNGGPLVRAAAAEALMPPLSAGAVDALVASAQDPVRLVRIKAASTLLRHFSAAVPADLARPLAKARGEYISSLMVRPDLWSSHVAMGTYFLEQKDAKSALLSFRAASKIDPSAVEPHVNASIAHAVLGDQDAAESELKEALRLDPHNAAALFNMGLLRNQQARPDEAVSYFKEAIRRDPFMAQAAYNIAVTLSGKSPREAALWAKRAYETFPDAKNGYTLAYYLKQDGDWDGAVSVLNALTTKYPSNVDAYLLLGEIHEKRGNPLEARKVYRKALDAPGIPAMERVKIEKRLKKLE